MKHTRIDGYPTFEPHQEKPGWFKIDQGFIFWINEYDFAPIKKGMEINGASIPWLLTFLFNRFHPHYNRGAAWHDPFCAEGDQDKALAFISGEWRELTWKESAQMFRKMLEIDGCPKWKAVLFFEAVMLKKRPKEWKRKITSFCSKLKQPTQ